MKKCILLFALLVLTLSTAVLLENENKLVQEASLQIGENNIEKTSLEQNGMYLMVEHNK